MESPPFDSSPSPPPFVPFHLYKATRMYRHNLPHWRQEGATYFVTFRLGDALPAEVTAQIKREQIQWLASKGITWDAAGVWRRELEALSRAERFDYTKRFNRKIQGYLDAGYDECVLRQPVLRAEVEKSLQFFHQDRLWVGDSSSCPTTFTS